MDLGTREGRTDAMKVDGILMFAGVLLMGWGVLNLNKPPLPARGKFYYVMSGQYQAIYTGAALLFVSMNKTRHLKKHPKTDSNDSGSA